MKEIKLWLVIAVLACLFFVIGEILFYFVVGFVNVSIDFRTWPQGGRFLFGLFTLIWAVISILASISFNEGILSILNELEKETKEV